jgi:pyruvate/2-oxoglutarate dehydrogenase complex dihydrolipoamide dehydrogenase (E3) component
LEDTGFWTSRTILEDNPDLPGRIIIIGGGVIGVETATILNDLGVEVTIVEMMDQLLPRMDTEIAENLLGRAGEIRYSRQAGASKSKKSAGAVQTRLVFWKPPTAKSCWKPMN